MYSNKDTIMGEVSLKCKRCKWGFHEICLQRGFSCLQIRVTPMTTKKIEHQSIRVQLLGQIELASERGTSHEFVSLCECAC